MEGVEVIIVIIVVIVGSSMVVVYIIRNLSWYLAVFFRSLLCQVLVNISGGDPKPSRPSSQKPQEATRPDFIIATVNPPLVEGKIIIHSYIL
jgi:hypothetical protein